MNGGKQTRGPRTNDSKVAGCRQRHEKNVRVV